MVDEEVPREDLRGLRVLHIQKTDGIGGSERHIVDLCAGLRARGAEARILWLAARAHALETLQALCRRQGVPFHRLPIRTDCDPRLCHTIRASLRQAPPQIVHLHLIHATLHGILAAIGTPHAIVATRHGTERYQRLPWFRILARLCDARSTRVIAPSEWVARYTRRWDGTPTTKLRVIPHGIDPEPFDRAARARPSASRDGCVITAIARLHPSKDHATLIEAFAVVTQRHRQARLQIVGDGPLRGRLEHQAARTLGSAVADGRLRFLGERAEIPEILGDSDIVILPGAREGFGLAALEAMAAGLPVIAPAGGALPELIEDHVSGLLVPPGDPASLAAAIDGLVRDPAQRRAMGKRARQSAARFTLDRMVATTAHLYREIVATCRATGGARRARD